mgnify:CR=1 FL=1
MNVLITGVGGLLGSRLADWLLENTDANVIGIDDLSGGYPQNIHKDVKFYEFDLATSVHEIDYVFEKHKPDYVFHFAAYAAEGLSPFIRKYNYTNNLVATANIINNCINYDVKRLVFTSSMAVYGENETPFVESMPRKPVDPYGVAKAACEMDIEIAGEQHGLDWCILRPHNVYGCKQNIWDKYRNVLGIWMYQYMKAEPITIFGDGEQTRAFSYIDDCLEPFWKAATSPLASKQIINIGGTKDVTINEAAKTLISVLPDGNAEIQYLEERHEVKHAFSSHDKSVELLGFKDTTSLRDGLQEMWDWAKHQPMKERKMFTYEVNKGIYDYWKVENANSSTNAIK